MLSLGIYNEEKRYSFYVGQIELLALNKRVVHFGVGAIGMASIATSVYQDISREINNDLANGENRINSLSEFIHILGTGIGSAALYRSGYLKYFILAAFHMSIIAHKSDIANMIAGTISIPLVIGTYLGLGILFAGASFLLLRGLSDL